MKSKIIVLVLLITFLLIPAVHAEEVAELNKWSGRPCKGRLY